MLRIDSNQVSQGEALIPTLTAKRNNRLAALDGQKTAYEIASCLVGSEMCIRDRVNVVTRACPCAI